MRTRTNENSKRNAKRCLRLNAWRQHTTAHRLNKTHESERKSVKIRKLRERERQRRRSSLFSFYNYNIFDVNYHIRCVSILYTYTVCIYIVHVRSCVSLWPTSTSCLQLICVIHSLFSRDRNEALLIKQWCVQINLLARLTFLLCN